MAKVKTNELIKALSGALGNLIFRPMPDGTTWVSVAPDFSRRKFSKGQKDHQERFRFASAYARRAAREEPIYAQLAKGTGKTAYNIALSDWFKSPVVHRIECRDGRIRVEASDNVMVTRVCVTISDEAGTIIERGDATSAEGDWWEYIPRSLAKRISVEAWDLAGNVGKLAL